MCYLKMLKYALCAASYLRLLADGRPVRARSTVLATGPWTCLLAGLRPEQLVRFTKGVHIEVPTLGFATPFSPDNIALLFTAPQDGRVFFANPWKGWTLVGTTDIFWEGDPDEARAGEEDIVYLLRALNACCPGLAFTRMDVSRTWYGLCILAKATGGPSSLSREWTLHHPEPRRWLPIGGKLTTARVDAVRIVDAVAAEGGWSPMIVPEVLHSCGGTLPSSPFILCYSLSSIRLKGR